jgi:hypothetical protein
MKITNYEDPEYVILFLSRCFLSFTLLCSIQYISFFGLAEQHAKCEKSLTSEMSI